MMHLILPATVIASVLSAQEAEVLKKLHGVWRIEGIALSPSLDHGALGRSVKTIIGEYVIWDTEQKLLVGLPRCSFARTVLRGESKDATGLRKVELRELDLDGGRFMPGIILVRQGSLLLCYSCLPGDEFPGDLEVARSSQPLILLTLRRIDNHPGLEDSRRMLAKLQGKWREAAVAVTDDRGELQTNIGELQGNVWTIRDHIIQVEVPARKKKL
ncbi:hypothetical protein HRbin36_00312 [bacterium HR36]|nr:hypothetical protein HRbin36_00312 [bacterium HR36]